MRYPYCPLPRFATTITLDNSQHYNNYPELQTSSECFNLNLCLLGLLLISIVPIVLLLATTP